jgi:hypothetical protein
MDELRKIAADTYNRAFELIIEGDEFSLLEGIELAATSLNLWRRIGRENNISIGLWLYSRALHKADLQSLAIEAAQESVRLARVSDIDWLIASSLEGLTRASQGLPNFETLLTETEQAIDQINDAEDRNLIESQFADLR